MLLTPVLAQRNTQPNERCVDEQVDPTGEHYEAGTFPTDLIPKMGDLGFYAPNLDGYGLPGLGERAYGLLMQEPSNAAGDRAQALERGIVDLGNLTPRRDSATFPTASEVTCTWH